MKSFHNSTHFLSINISPVTQLPNYVNVMCALLIEIFFPKFFFLLFSPAFSFSNTLCFVRRILAFEGARQAQEHFPFFRALNSPKRGINDGFADFLTLPPKNPREQFSSLLSHGIRFHSLLLLLISADYL